MNAAGIICLLAVTTAAPVSLTIMQDPGIRFVHMNSPTRQKYLIETMGAGVAAFDYNNDGRLDLFFVNSGRLTDPMRMPELFDRDQPQYWNRLYRQNENGTFTDVTEAAGLSRAGNANYGMGVATGDYDNDGYTDLYVTNYGKNTLYRNNGDGTFTDVTAQAGVAAGGWSASAGFFDYDGDGRLDLLVTRYMEWDTAHSKICGGERRTYCPPGEFPPTTNILYRNRGDGTFEDVSRKAGIAKPARSLGVAFNDYDGDGRADIFVANDGMEQFLFHNKGDGTFAEVALEAGVSLSDDGKAYAGMGVDFRDYDNDGKPDLIVTNLARQVYAVYRNDGNGAFTYQSRETGLGVLTSGSSGWGMRLADFNNDGWKDLFIAQGHVMDNVESIDPSLKYKETPLFALNHSGRFERTPLSTERAAGRGAAFGDFRNNGAMGVVMTVLGGAPVLFQNSHTANHWIELALEGTVSNRDGFGAKVSIAGQTQYATSAGSYLSASDKRVHFGLGAESKATIEITWPSGTKQKLDNIAADQILPVREPERR